MPVGQTPELDNEKILKQLKASYDMYEKTKKETEIEMKKKLLPDGSKKYTKEDIEKQIELITNSQNDIVENYVLLGGNPEDLKKKTRKKTTTAASDDSGKKDIQETIRDMMEKMNADREEELNKIIYQQKVIIILRPHLMLFHCHQKARAMQIKLQKHLLHTLQLMMKI